MPSSLHEMLVEMFRERPELAADLLGGALGAPLPAFQHVELTSAELSDVAPTEYRADAVVKLTVNTKPVWAVVVEVQLRTDVRKRRSWPAYVATLYARLGCPVALLVVCHKPRVARWCAKPVPVGYPGMVLTPLVWCTDRAPRVTDVATAERSPELAVLSALIHGPGPNPQEVLNVLPTALAAVDSFHAAMYSDYVSAALPAAAKKYLEAQMAIAGYEFQSEFAREYYAAGKADGEAQGKVEGKVEGIAQAILDFLKARQLEVPADVRERIVSCTDPDQLATWVSRAATVSDARELVAP